MSDRTLRPSDERKNVSRLQKQVWMPDRKRHCLESINKALDLQ